MSAVEFNVNGLMRVTESSFASSSQRDIAPVIKANSYDSMR